MPECHIPGTLRNVNTLEARGVFLMRDWRARRLAHARNTARQDFKQLGKNALLTGVAQQIWDDIHSGAAVEDPSKLQRFLLICFADLKSHQIFYWFAFPAIVSPRNFLLEAAPRLLSACFAPEEISQLHSSLDRLRLAEASSGRPFCPGCFLIVRPSAGADASSAEGAELHVAPLSEWEHLDEPTRARVLFGFVDPCCREANPGWPLRNFLILLSARWGRTQACVVCYRGRLARLDGGPPSSVGDFETGATRKRGRPKSSC